MGVGDVSPGTSLGGSVVASGGISLNKQKLNPNGLTPGTRTTNWAPGTPIQSSPIAESAPGFGEAANGLAGGPPTPPPVGSGVGGAVQAYSPAYLDPYIAAQLGWSNGTYENQRNAYQQNYGYDRRALDIKGQMYDLDRKDIGYDQNGVELDRQGIRYDQDYLNGDNALINYQKQLIGEATANQIAQLNTKNATDKLDLENQYVGNGGFFTPGNEFRKQNLATSLQQQIAAAQNQGAMSTSVKDRELGNNTNRLNQSNVAMERTNLAMGKLQNSLARTGLNINLNNVNKEQLEAGLQQHLSQLGIAQYASAQKILEAAAKGQGQEATAAQQMLYDYLKSTGQVPGGY